MAASSLGSLVVSLEANLVKFEESLNRAQYLAAKTAKGIDDSMAAIKNAAVKTAEAYVSFKTVEYFAGQVEGAIEAQAALFKLSEQTGVTVEQLSGLKNVAALSGVSMERVGGVLTTLSRSMFEVASGTGRAREAFLTLGINVKDATGHMRPSTEVLQELAQKLTTASDKTLAVGLAEKALRGEGAALMPFLRDLAEIGALQATTTAEQAQRAEEFERTLIKLSLTQKALYNVIAGEVVPVLDALARTFLATAQGTDGLLAKTKELAASHEIRDWAFEIGMLIARSVDFVRVFVEGLKLIPTAVTAIVVSLQFSLETVVKFFDAASDAAQGLGLVLQGMALAGMGQFVAGAVLMKSGMEEISGAARVFGQDFDAGAQKAKDAWGDLYKQIDDLSVAFQQTKFSDEFQAQFTALINNFKLLKTEGTRSMEVVKKASGDAITSLIDSLTKENAGLEEAIAHMRMFGTEVKSTAAAQTLARLETEQGRTELHRYAVEYTMTDEAAKKVVMRLAELKDVLVRDAANLKAAVDQLHSMNDTLFSLDNQIATVGMTTDEVTANMAAKWKLAVEAMRAYGGAFFIDDKELAKLLPLFDAIIAKTEEMSVKQKALRDQQNLVHMAMEAADAVGQIAVGFAHGVTQGIEVARAKLKQFLYDLIEIMAKKWFLNIAAQYAGSAGGPLASAAGQVGQGTLAGAASQALFGGAEGAGLLGGNGLTATIGGAAFDVATSFGAAADSAALFANAVMDLIPVVGWITAAYTVYKMFFDKHGGPKQEGEYFTGGGSAFNITGTQLDETAKTISEGLLATIEKTARSLGGSAAGMFNVGTMIVNDPQGTAPSFVDTLLKTTGGSTLFLQDNANVGRSPEDVAKEIGLQGSRALLIAMQSLDFADPIDAILHSITDVTTATQEQITAVLSKAAEMAQVISGLASLGVPGLDVNALKLMQHEGEALSNTFKEVAANTAKYYDLFYTDAEKQQRTWASLGDTFASLGVALPKNDADFRTLVESLDLTDAAQASLYRSLMALAPAFDAAADAADKAVDEFNSIAGGLSPAFGVGNARSVLESAVADWMNVSPWNAAGNTVESTIANIGSLISSNNLGAARTYAESLGPGALSTLNAMLRAYAMWQSAMNSGGAKTATAVNTLGESATNTASAFDETAAQLMESRKSLSDWLNGLVTGDLSNFTPMEKLSTLHSQYQVLLEAVQGGDTGSTSKLTAAADAYLKMAREIFASSAGYNVIFDEIRRGIGGIVSGAGGGPVSSAGPVTLGPDGRPIGPGGVMMGPGPLIDSTTQMVSAQQESTSVLDQLLIAIRNGLNVSDPATQALLEKIALQLDKSNTGAPPLIPVGGGIGGR